MMCHAGFGGVDARRRVLLLLQTFAGGYGGRPGSDGPDTVQYAHKNTRTRRSRRPS